MRAPCPLPELESIEFVRVEDERYFPVEFSAGKRSWNALKHLLESGGVLPLRRRAGYLSYREDPTVCGGGLERGLHRVLRDIRAPRSRSGSDRAPSGKWSCSSMDGAG